MKATSIITLNLTCIGDTLADPIRCEEVAKQWARVIKCGFMIDDVTVEKAKVFLHEEDAEHETI